MNKHIKRAVFALSPIQGRLGGISRVSVNFARCLIGVKPDISDETIRDVVLEILDDPMDVACLGSRHLPDGSVVEEIVESFAAIAQGTRLCGSEMKGELQ